MAKEMEFFSFLMEQYAAYKGTTANKILAQLEVCFKNNRFSFPTFPLGIVTPWGGDCRRTCVAFLPPPHESVGNA